MPIEQGLLDAIGQALGTAVLPSLTSQSATSDLFEAYVLGVLLEAAEAEGGRIKYWDVYGKATNQFVFRTSPGFIFSTARRYTHAEIQFTGCPQLEAHMGVLVAGTSKVLHECDIAVLYEAEAETCRQNQVHPRSSELLLAVECKFYSVPLKLDLARSFVGLGVDLGVKNCRFVVNTTSNVVGKLLSKHRCQMWEHQLSPGSTTAIERLRNSFQEVFKNFCARYR